MKKKSRLGRWLTALLLPVILFSSAAEAYDGSIDQGADHSSETGMYRYAFEMSLDNPCNSKDMDKDAINELWFDIDYQSDNGYGSVKTYRFDLSWKDGRNQNEAVVRNCFIRPDDHACQTKFDLWVPGLIQKVRIHLNMDGGERLAFTLNGVFLNGLRVNTETDYVSSCYYDSEAGIACYIPSAGVTGDGTGRYDQYGGLLTPQNLKEAIRRAASGDGGMFYHYGE